MKSSTRKKIKVAKAEAKAKSVNEVRLAAKKEEYIAQLFNGLYYVERCNVMAEQLKSGKITEMIDGCSKTKGLMVAEYYLMKMQAIHSMRDAHFAKQSLLNDFHLTAEDILNYELSYREGKIVKELYDEPKPIKHKAEFVKTS